MGIPPSKTRHAGDTVVIPEREEELLREKAAGGCVSRNRGPSLLTRLRAPPRAGVEGQVLR